MNAGTVAEAPRGHDPYSASKASRWMACPGCVNFCQGMPDTSGKAAERGTRIHTYAEAMAKGQPVVQIDGTTEVEFAEESAIAAKMEAKAREVEALYIHPDDQMVVLEAELDLRHLGIQMPGFADRLVVGEDVVIVGDYKGGKVYVPSAGNPQGAIYCSGAARQAGVSRAIFVIYQMNHSGECEARAWELSAADLAEWESFIGARRRIAETSTVLIPGEHCKYCPAKKLAKCPALVSSIAIPSSVPSWDVYWASLAIESQGEILDRLSAAEDLIKEIWGHAEQASQASGVCPTGYRMAAGRKTRFFPDEHAAEAALTAALDELGLPATAMWKPAELRSVSDLEKRKEIPKEIWGHLVAEKSGEPKLAVVASKKAGKKAVSSAEAEVQA